ncbi:sporulation protein [Allgaiera indica]|uniref:Sporulation protein n=1 Tax=Allgaiera indica TaxID=765699 RepID=A0AAN4ZZ59_9RHOB|nr:SPOR domain-containing protein [Allgaiera indica]GHE00625.1 sporulation protein [Allgaiera indica]
MAEIEFDRQGQAHSGPQPGGLQGYINIAGAVTSLALIIGVGVWGYNLVRRDAAGVPVIKALKGPMRVAPEDPGGQIARNVGLAVNAVAADEPLPPPPDRVVLAPSPVSLSPDDMAPDAITGHPDATGASGAAAPAAAPPAAEGQAQGADAAPAAAAPAEPRDPVEVALAAARAATEALTGEGPQPVTGGTAEAVRNSIRPMLRPSGQTAPIDQPPKVLKTVSIDPASLRPGTRLVQLGAYPSVAAAQSAWNGIVTQFGQLMDKHGQVIQQAESGGRVFYRLRAAGFAAESEARAFCAALQAQNAGCIPVTIR